MVDGLIDRLQRETGVADLLDVLATRMAPTDLQSLLLEVSRRRARRVPPARLLEQYRCNRFVGPSTVDPRAAVEIERAAWAALPRGYRPIELSPLCPLGAHSVVATVDQNKVVSTTRNTEVVADSTNVLALEAATLRRMLRVSPGHREDAVLLATSQRVTRAQGLPGPGAFAHFRLLSLCAAGRDQGSWSFEATRLEEHLAYYLDLLGRLAAAGGPLVRFRVAVTALDDSRIGALEDRVLAPVARRFPEARCHLDPSRTGGRGYYRDACFRLYASDAGGAEIEIGDGGLTDWTQRLVSDAKERLLISALALERLCLAGRSGSGTGSERRAAAGS